MTSSTTLTDQAGIVLGPSAQDLYDAADLILPADDRIQLPVKGHLGEIPAVLLQGAPVLTLGAGLLQVVSVGGSILSHRRQKLKIYSGDIGPHCLQDLGSDIVLLKNDGKQDVLCPDPVGTVPVCLGGCHSEHLLASGGISLLVQERQTPRMDVELGDHLLQPLPGNPVFRQNL